MAFFANFNFRGIHKTYKQLSLFSHSNHINDPVEGFLVRPIVILTKTSSRQIINVI